MQAARVIRMAGYGAKDLADAIASGMVTGDVRRMAEAAMKENAELKARLRKALEENRALMSINAEYRRMEDATIRAAIEAQEASRSRRDFPMACTVGLVSAGALAAMLLTVAALLR